MRDAVWGRSLHAPARSGVITAPALGWNSGRLESVTARPHVRVAGPAAFQDDSKVPAKVHQTRAVGPDDVRQPQ